METPEEQELPLWLFELYEDLLSRVPRNGQVNTEASIRNTIERWAKNKGYQVGYNFQADWLRREAEAGRIPLVVIREEGKRLAIMISQYDQAWELEQLVFCQSRGWEDSLWIRWGEPLHMDEEPMHGLLRRADAVGVHIIHLPTQEASLQAPTAIKQDDPIAVECPYCGAPPGMPCLGVIRYHRARREAFS